MSNLKLSEIAVQTQEALSKLGFKKKTLENYKFDGFYPILAYFKKNNLTYYSKEAVAEVVMQTYLRYERGETYYAKFQSVRRIASWLDETENGAALNRKPLEPWKVNPYHEFPKGILDDNHNISTLVYNTRQAMSGLGLSKKTIKNYLYEGFDVILRHFMENGILHYSEDDLNKFVFTTRTQYEMHRIGRSKYQTVRKTASMLYEYYNSCTLTWKVLPNYDTKELMGGFAYALEKYINYQSLPGGMAATTIRTYRNILLQYLYHFQEKGYSTPVRISLIDISNYIPVIALRQPSNMKSVMCALRSFSAFVYEHKLTETDLTPALFAAPALRRKHHEGFTTDETDRILAAVDRTTTAGSRDYAIFILAIHTGLRAIDISGLQLKDIDWHRNEIRIVQSKNKRPLALPLEATVGNAIADYILNSRSECGSPYIFLRQMRPYGKLNNIGMSAVASRYIDKAGIENNSELRKGFHSFRRALGTNMLESGVSMYTISEVLGHADPDSSKPYLSADHENLRMCCLPLTGIKVTRRELV
ncbi:MAG: site-specific integrase [Clostridiales bacterium]|nr:site-specific integrase [Clostridiales bacterium]